MGGRLAAAALGVAVLALVAGALVAWQPWRAREAARSAPGDDGTDAVGCSRIEQLAYHVHAHLAIFVEGQPLTVPANIGSHPTCIAWLHTHATDGLIHVEAPAPHTYPLGSFFQVWGQPLDETHLLDRTTDPQHELRSFLNGQPFNGPPQRIPLTPHAVIVLEYGPPFVPPPPHTFAPGE